MAHQPVRNFGIITPIDHGKSTLAGRFPGPGERAMSRRRFLQLAGAGALGMALGSVACAVKRHPNFVFILVDDLGWTDLGCYGSDYYETPNIDRLARQGMRFTQAYAASPVCSPTRAAVLTGKYPARLHLTDWIAGHYQPWHPLEVPRFKQQLPLEETTIAEALKELGYASASIGKWHLGGEPYYPEKQGFDLNIAGTERGQPPSYYYPYTNQRYTIPTLPKGEPGLYLTDRLTQEAVNFIEDSRPRPFLLYLPYFAVHSPIQGRSDLLAKYADKQPGREHRNSGYAAMIEALDQGVGRIMAALESQGLAEDTVIFFTSDNGGQTRHTSNAPLRSGKSSLYEGGIRVPLIVRWPAKIKADSNCQVPVSSPDFYPTMLELAGGSVRGRADLDGLSLAGILTGSRSLSHDALYWHYPHYHPSGPTSPSGAVRVGDYKLIEYFEDGRLELFNLAEDLGETRDLAAERPDTAAQLRDRLHQWRQSIDARMPAPNPNYDPARDQWLDRTRGEKSIR